VVIRLYVVFIVPKALLLERLVVDPKISELAFVETLLTDCM
jgi:hypothetical protein